MPEEYLEEFKPLFKPKRTVGTLLEGFSSVPPTISDSTSLSTSSWCMDPEKHELLKFSKVGIFTDGEVEELKRMYGLLTNISETSIHVPNAYTKYQQVYINGKILGSNKSRSVTSSIVMAIPYPSHEERPVHFARHLVMISDTSHTFLLFHAAWYKPHQEKDKFRKPVTVWESDIYEIRNFDLLPVQFVKSRTVSLTDKLDSGETVLLVHVPLH